MEKTGYPDLTAALSPFLKSHKPDFEQIKQDIARLLESILKRRIPDFFVDPIVHPYTKFDSETQFWEGYMTKTLGLLRTIKKVKSIPLVFYDCYVIFFHKPQITFQEGDFFFQAGASTPGTLALKFYWNDALRPATVMESELPRLTDEQFYKEKCRESNVGTNVFRNLVLSKGENECERLPISEMFQLFETMSERDLIGSEMTSEVSSRSSSGFDDTEQRSRASSLPEKRRAKSFTFEGQMSFTGILTPKADRETQSPESIHPPYVTQPSSECHQPNSFVYPERDEEPHPMAVAVQDEGNDTGNSPAVIARELAKVEALKLGGQTSADGYPDVKGALASSKKDGGKETRSSSSGSPRAGRSLASGSDLDRKVTRGELQRVAFHIAASCWKTLAWELNVNADAVEQTNRADPSNCPFDTLHRWLNQKGSHATVRRLCKTLTDKRIGQRNAAENVYGTDVVNQITEHPE